MDGTMVDLEALTDFVLVAANGGITQASRVSRRPKASLSRKVMELETSLGVRLFDRGSRSVRLTEEGELLYSRTTGPLGDITEVIELLRDGGAKPRGRLRINVPQVFGQLLMGRIAAEFTSAYPDVILDVTMEDRAIDLVGEGYDIVIRLDPEPETDLVGRCFVRDQVLLVAAPTLPCPAATPHPADEGAVPVIVRNGTPSTAAWHIYGAEAREIRIRSVLQLPSHSMIRQAVLTGIGAARLPRVLVADDLASSRLVSWGPAVERPAEIWALHASSRLAPAKVKAFMRFLDATFPGEWL
jgi:DNA-binding transcriptional LysR family regulator